MPYQLGVTPANMQELTDLGLPDPLWEPLSDWAAFSGTKQKGTGEVVGTGRPVFAWRFNELTIAQMGILLYYVSTGGALVASKFVYVRTRIMAADMTERVFESYRALMHCPFEPQNARYDLYRKYRDVTVRFTQAEVLT
jgi:hypothetical protein